MRENKDAGPGARAKAAWGEDMEATGILEGVRTARRRARGVRRRRRRGREEEAGCWSGGQEELRQRDSAMVCVWGTVK